MFGRSRETPKGLKKSSEKERKRRVGGDEGANVGLMDYTKEPRRQITYNNLETGIQSVCLGGAGEEVCAHIEIAAVFQCSASVCGKADSKEMTKHRHQIDVFFWVSVRKRGCMRVLLFIMIVLFSSVQCLYSRRLQEGSRVKQ